MVKRQKCMLQTELTYGVLEPGQLDSCFLINVDETEMYYRPNLLLESLLNGKRDRKVYRRSTPGVGSV